MLTCDKHIAFLLILWLFMILACRKAHERTCFKAWGTTVNIKKKIAPFKTLVLQDDYDVFIVQDSLNYAEVWGGENMVSHLSFTEKNQTLEIKDLNKCHFLRDYDKRIKISLHTSGFDTLIFKGAGHILGVQTLFFDTLFILNYNSSGLINFTVSAHHVYSKIITGTTDIIISGKAKFSYAYNGSFGKIVHKDLRTSDAQCFHEGTGVIEIFSDSLLNVKMKGTGPVYVYGSPQIIKKDLTGKGSLVFR